LSPQMANKPAHPATKIGCFKKLKISPRFC
jgi:hypothetical protein